MFNNKFVSWAALLGLDIGILEFFLCSIEQSLLLGIILDLLENAKLKKTLLP